MPVLQEVVKIGVKLKLLAVLTRIIGEFRMSEFRMRELKFQLNSYMSALCPNGTFAY